MSNNTAYILDVQSEVYVWLGAQVNEEVKRRALETAQDYVRAAFDGRLQTTPMYAITPGNEPTLFRCHFPSWIEVCVSPLFSSSRPFQTMNDE